eukprot:CAMPEP_0181504650 /NCGR_PEP_ID=MMETSP1110-20121109/57627_1 /TAXON_ID=174948 /ORGANISM="Symbiodinium sp., Strain CCMP421" /LENGTH=47 /DNA_ID= /DNA_START= /DNA_END= /DNA_ORIENTATION=
MTSATSMTGHVLLLFKNSASMQAFQSLGLGSRNGPECAQNTARTSAE